jgi:hypothetical protein
MYKKQMSRNRSIPDYHNRQRLQYFGMLRSVVFVRTDVSEEHIASIITGTRIYELGTTLAVTSN